MYLKKKKVLIHAALLCSLAFYIENICEKLVYSVSGCAGEVRRSHKMDPSD